MVDSALSMPKNETPDFSLPVAALFDKADRDELLALIEKYPEVKFLIYAPDSGIKTKPVGRPLMTSRLEIRDPLS